MASVLSVYRLCLRCGPNIAACERARNGKACPAPKITCSSKKQRDNIVEAWHKKLVESRAAHYPPHFSTQTEDETK